ncbi:MAG: hypothetical protein AAGE93_02875 [Bacteroidota bacterium]
MPTPSWLLLRNTPEDVVATPFLNDQACQKLFSYAKVSADRPSYTIWLTQIEQIHQFVYRIPDLAWELMDYATEPLSLVYSHVKPFLSEEPAPAEVCIRLINEPPLQKVLSNRYAWLNIALDVLSQEISITDKVKKEINIKNKAMPHRAIKIMRVYDNGEFSFIP